MTTEEILAAARAAKKPAEAPTTAKAPPAEANASSGPPPRRKLTAADILAIANGQLSIRREQPVVSKPLEEETLPDPGDARPASLPEPIQKRKLTAADIRDLGLRQ